MCQKPVALPSARPPTTHKWSQMPGHQTRSSRDDSSKYICPQQCRMSQDTPGIPERTSFEHEAFLSASWTSVWVRQLPGGDKILKNWIHPLNLQLHTHCHTTRGSMTTHPTPPRPSGTEFYFFGKPARGMFLLYTTRYKGQQVHPPSSSGTFRDTKLH